MYEPDNGPDPEAGKELAPGATAGDPGDGSSGSQDRAAGAPGPSSGSAIQRARLKVANYTRPAGGLGAITSTLRFTLREMGPIRGTRTLLRINQVKGFDCPGCAWPDPAHRSSVEFCENGVKAVAAEATTRRITPAFFRTWSIPRLLEQTDHWLEAQGRLTHPMVRRPGSDSYEPIAWDEAFSLIARELNSLETPDEALFYTSGRTSNEAAFLYQLFVRQFGTNNLPDCSNLCHESSGTGMNEVLGVGKGTVSLQDFDLADAIFVIGQNPGSNHPRMMSSLEAAARRGCRIVSINPLKEVALVRFGHPQTVRGLLGNGTPIAELFLQVRINGDVALLKGIMKEVIEAERRQPGHVLDQAFIQAHTHGFEAFAESIKAISWERIEQESGVSRDEIRRAAGIYIGAERVICCWAMGLTQHKNGVGNIQEVVNLLLLRGNMGRPGAGACPVRGHSNVQGDRTMGIYERPKAEFLDRLGKVFGFEPPRTHGFSVVEALKALHAGRAQVLFALGGNFHSATPDTRFTEQALQRAKLTVHVSTKLNRSHLVTGRQALILPCLGRTEIDLQASGPQFVTVEDSMSMVHASRGHLPPASDQLLSEPAIVARLAAATLDQRSAVDWRGVVEDYGHIRDLIEAVIPGFERFNERIQQPGGFQLPNAARNRDFRTATGRAQFTVLPLPQHDLRPGQFLMMTIRSHDQYNTTIYGLDDRYRGIYQERRVVLMNAADIAEEGLVESQVIDLVSRFQGIERVAHQFIVVPYDVPRRCLATYFPEANVLVPVDLYADRSLTPASKSVVVELRPAVSLEPSAPLLGSLPVVPTF